LDSDCLGKVAIFLLQNDERAATDYKAGALDSRRFPNPAESNANNDNDDEVTQHFVSSAGRVFLQGAASLNLSSIYKNEGRKSRMGKKRDAKESAVTLGLGDRWIETCSSSRCWNIRAAAT
jgi:hypothetical protein